MASISELARLAKLAAASGSQWVGGSEVWNMDVKHIRSAPPSSPNPTDLCHNPIPSEQPHSKKTYVVNCLGGVRLSPELSP